MALKQIKPGQPPKGRIQIFDHTKTISLGSVTPASSDANVSRFTGRRGSTLQKVAGKTAWVAPAPKGKSK